MSTSYAHQQSFVFFLQLMNCGLLTLKQKQQIFSVPSTCLPVGSLQCQYHDVIISCGILEMPARDISEQQICTTGGPEV